MEEKVYFTGSRAFFDGMEGFEPHDTDLLAFNPSLACPGMRSDSGEKSTLFQWKSDDKEELISFMLKWPEPAHRVCLFLVPDIAQRIGLSIEDLPRLKPLVDRLDAKHRYLADIYEAYIENKEFILTESQKTKAFKTYKDERKL